MKYLLDTHVILWYLFEDEKLSRNAAKLLKRLDIDIFISAVNFWEISIKHNIGKLDLKGLLPNDLPERCINYGFKMINLSIDDTASFHQLENVHHRDPFDRMLIWQDIQNNFVLVSNDANMPYYKQDGLRLLW